MTKAMMARLWVVGAVLLGLTFFAGQAWGATSSSTSLEATAERPVASAGGQLAPATTAAERASQPTGEPDARPTAAQPTGEPDARPTAARQAGEPDARPTAARPAGEPQVEAAALAQDGDGDVTMTLLHNNDGESKLLPNIAGGFPGIARFAETWVGLGRTSDADILLRVSAGDNFLASKEFAASLARDDQPFYDSIALRGLYEVMGLGNHDFDFGPDITARFIEGFRLNPASAPVTFVAANIDVTDEPALQALADTGRIAPSAVYTDPTSGLSVGVIGAITPRLSNISSPRNVTVDADVAGAVNAQVVALAADGVDRIVLVSHLQGLLEDRDLIELLSGVDIVVAGGGDELLKNDGDTCQQDEAAAGPYPLVMTDLDGNDVPVVTAPGGYRCIGRLDVTFDRDGNLTLTEGTSIGVPLDGDVEEFAMSRVEEPLAAALAELEATVIGASDVVLDGRRTSVRTASSNLGELLADALLATGRAGPEFGGSVADVAVQNGGGIRNDAEIPAGDITEADTFDIAPFANFVVVGDVPRDQFKEMLEVAVAGLPDAEGTFPQIGGFTIEIDASQPGRQVERDGDCSLTGDPGSRIRNVTLDDGTEIVTDGTVVAGDDIALATIDFLATGGDCYPLDDLTFATVGSSYQQALSTFISDELDGSISATDYPVGGSRITITNLDAATATATATDATPSSDATDDTDPADDDATEPDADDTETDDGELPNTGLDSSLILIIALTAGAAGLLIFFEAQRAGWLSLTNRLSATRAWFPSNDD